MARLTQAQSADIRAAIQAAVDDGYIAPTDVIEYLMDNGCDPLPTRMTVISILRECGIEYVLGYWTRTR